MTNVNLYFIGIAVEGELADQIRSFQIILRDKYGVSRQLKIPPHITLIPPFRTDDSGLKKIVAVSMDVLKDEGSFDVKVNGFGHFREKVLFVQVERTTEIMNLQKKLKLLLHERAGLNDNYPEQEFTPHITLANRDMKVSGFQRIWPEFEGRVLHEKIQISHITLYKHLEGIWTPSLNFELC